MGLCLCLAHYSSHASLWMEKHTSWSVLEDMPVHLPPPHSSLSSFPCLLAPADHSPDKLLRIKFAGVAITRPMESKKWLEQELAQRPVWFTPLTVNRDQQALECVVLSKRKVSYFCPLLCYFTLYQHHTTGGAPEEVQCEQGTPG